MSGPEKGASRIARALEALQAFRALGGGNVDRFLAEHEDLRDLLEPLLSAGVEVGGDIEETLVELMPGAELGGTAAPVELGSGRYALHGEVARGGMGAILRVWDKDLRRHLAMKIILDHLDPKAKAAPGSLSSREALRRFLDEAQITGQLDHPGVVPVHELGIDARGRAFFTMQLVRGKTLREVFRLAWEEKEGWTQARVLELFIKVCDTLAYAHSKGVVHRDIKPSNVMVGKYGQVYVMDWGLAKVLGKEGPKELEIDRDEPPSVTRIRTQDDADGSTSGPLLTQDGTVVGTPNYMPPEQALGKVEEIGPTADVYSVGAMLYEFLARTAPYKPREGKISPRQVLWAVAHHEPSSLDTEARSAPRDLIAVCQKAMSRDLRERYAEASALAMDLRAFLDGKVVRALRAGPLAELLKWGARNRAVSATLLAASVIVVLLVILYVKDVTDARDAASFQKDLATATLREVQAFAMAAQVEQLREEADNLWPLESSMLPRLESWLSRAKALVPIYELLRDKLDRISTGDLPVAADHGPLEVDMRKHAEWDSLQSIEYAAAHEATGAQREELLAQARRVRKRIHSECTRTRFDDSELTRRYLYLRSLVKRLDQLVNGPEDQLSGLVPKALMGKVASLRSASIPGIQERSSAIREQQEASTLSHGAKAAWSEAIQYAALATGPYRFSLSPVEGVFPLGVNPRSKLLEFWHVASGNRPSLKPDSFGQVGSWEVDHDTGMIFVLIPPGEYSLSIAAGATGRPPWVPAYLQRTGGWSSKCMKSTLDAFWISKYPVTLQQWMRWGHKPSLYFTCRSGRAQLLDQVSYVECQEWARCAGMDLPSEFQWDVAFSAGLAGHSEFELDSKENNSCRALLAETKPNALGVQYAADWAEWCKDPLYTLMGMPRVGDGLRWFTSIDERDRGPRVCRKASVASAGDPPDSLRLGMQPHDRRASVGFRPVINTIKSDDE